MKHPNPMTYKMKETIWHLWKAGDPMANISKVLSKPPATIFSYLQYHGGIRPRLRSRSLNSLTIRERETITRGLASGDSIRAIARQLERSPSTVCREVNNNGGSSKYRAIDADNAAWKRGKRPKQCLLSINRQLRDLIASKISDDWSPEQISGWLRRHHPNDEKMRVSHETIYKSLFIETRNIFHKKLRKHLRTKRKFRQAKAHKVGSRGRIIGGVSIHDRPADIESRATLGHWEGDLIVGSNNSHIATVVERSTRFTMLVQVDSKKTSDVVGSLSKQLSQLPEVFKKTLTWDRGTELAAHAELTVATGMDVYFCDPSSPWQRGTNENTNGLLRQYFPKGTSLKGYSQYYLDSIASKLNDRPRKTLKYHTPHDMLNMVLL